MSEGDTQTATGEPDTAGATAAPEAPAAPAEGGEAQEPKGPPSAREARRQSLRRAREQGRNLFSDANEPSESAQEPAEGEPAPTATKKNHGGKDQPMSPDGKYAKQEGAEEGADDSTTRASQEGEPGSDPEASQEGEPEDDTDPEASQEDEPEGQDADGEASQEGEPETVRIELPTALQAQGRTEEEVPKHLETLFRTLAKGYTRTQKVQGLADRLTEVEGELREAKSELLRRDAHVEASQEWRQSPEYKKIEETYWRLHAEDPESASTFWDNSRARIRELAEKKYETLSEEAESKEIEGIKKEQRHVALRATQGLPGEVHLHPDFQGEFSKAWDAYQWELEQGHIPEERFKNREGRPDPRKFHQEFARRLQTRLMADTRFRQPMLRYLRSRAATKRPRNGDAPPPQSKPKPADPPQKSEEEIRQEAIRDNNRSQVETRVKNPKHPIGELGPSNANRTTVVKDDGQEIDPSTMTKAELRKASLRRARKAGAAIGR